MRILVAFVSFCILLASCHLQSNRLESPNGKIIVEYNNENEFIVSYKGDDVTPEVLKISQMGVNTLGGGTYTLKGASDVIMITDDYEMLSGKRKRCFNQANERIYHFEDEEGLKMELILRAYNDGIAFRYHFPEPGTGVVVTGETTTFIVAKAIKRWTQEFMVGYEGFYYPNTDGIAKNQGTYWGFPALFEAANETFVLLTEANICKNNSGAYLSNEDNRSAYQVVLSDNQQVCGTDWYSPWRIAMIGSLADIVESTLVTDVSEPCKLEDTSWIKPGLVSWIYWAYNHGSKDYQIVKKYIDFAADFQLPYVLIDWEWDVMSNGGNLYDALQYAKEKGIAPLIWYNSSTAWPGPTPLYRLNTTEARAKEMAWLKEIGIKGIKVDFFHGDSISTMNYYIDILEDAAKYGLMVNFHGAAIPRGWQRTYPNFMSAEAVYGAEWYNNNEVLTDNAPWHNCTLPFTRNVIGPMDYTPCTFTDSQHPHITSDAHELALLVVFESALQHLADRPEGYQQQAAEVQALISSLPSCWDDTKLLSGYPSEYVVMARQKDNCWYIAGLNGGGTNRSLEVDLNFIKDEIQSIQTFTDKPQGKGLQIHSSPAEEKNVSFECQPNGGFVMCVVTK